MCTVSTLQYRRESSLYEMFCLVILGDRLSDEDVDQLFQSQEDAQGNINYEGSTTFLILLLIWCWNCIHSEMWEGREGLVWMTKYYAKMILNCIILGHLYHHIMKRHSFTGADPGFQVRGGCT